VAPRPGALKNTNLRFGDHWVKPLDEQSIEKIASGWRDLAKEFFEFDYFNIVDFVNKVFQRRFYRGERLRLKFMERSAVNPAKVSYMPLTLHVRVDVWAAARADEPWARYVIAHECGHVVLHDHEAKGYSTPNAKRLPPEEFERSAEWQADRFADFLLAPTMIVDRQRAARAAAVRCGIPNEVAERRFAEVTVYWQENATLHDLSPCDECYGYEAFRIGSRVRCRCGKVSTLPL
jgi:Zn-dependent peptidase ImmA (M78 family)